MNAKERLFLTAKRDRLVAEGDPEGATLYAAPGDEIPDEAVERFGLVDGGLSSGEAKLTKKEAAAAAKAAKEAEEAAAKEAEEAAAKEAAAAANKEAQGDGTKDAGK